MTHLALRLTMRSEARNTSTSRFTSNNEVRSKESSFFTSNNEVRSKELERHALCLTARSEA
jgi:hypothetical protein